MVELNNNVANNTNLKVRVQKVDKLGRGQATGRRKDAVAVAWISLGDGNITVNNKKMQEYFTRELYRADVEKAFDVIGRNFDVIATTHGGGLTGQSGALKLAISRAAVNLNPALYPALRKAGLLTFDNRRVERKKTGLVKARKAKPTSRR